MLRARYVQYRHFFRPIMRLQYGMDRHTLRCALRGAQRAVQWGRYMQGQWYLHVQDGLGTIQHNTRRQGRLRMSYIHSNSMLWTWKLHGSDRRHIIPVHVQ